MNTVECFFLYRRPIGGLGSFCLRAVKALTKALLTTYTNSHNRTTLVLSTTDLEIPYLLTSSIIVYVLILYYLIIYETV